MRADRVHISKLCEAAWIQDVRGAAQRHGRAIQALRDYTDQVDRLVQLRVMPDPVMWRYEVVEVPMTIFDAAIGLPVSAFSPDSPRIDVLDAQGPAMKLVLDRSDAKITLAMIPKARCLVHGTWSLPKDPIRSRGLPAE